jgi:HTH-type transcriptional regulator/antitoxin HigA
MSERRPAEVFPPGEFLSDELEARGWTQLEFAEIIRRPSKLVNEIIAGKKAITPDTAREFSAALGTSPQFWLNLETAYQLWKSEPSANVKVIERDAALRAKYPVRDLVKRGWVLPSESFDVLEQQVFRFYGVSSINDNPRFLHAARRNDDEGITSLQFAWLFRVKALASSLRIAKYSESKLRECLSSLELLLTEPEEVRHVPKLLSDCGVRLVIVEPIPGSKIDGACFWINENTSPVIGLTLKGDYMDRFWFNLRHEIEHVLRGDGKQEVRIDDFEAGTDDEDVAEKAANEAAENFCVPSKAMADFILRHDPMYSTTSFVGFSRLMKRHPGIVAGQLQHKINRPELFKKFQVRIRELLIQTALTDGYGRHAPLSI